jgi:hypothetical protein
MTKGKHMSLRLKISMINEELQTRRQRPLSVAEIGRISRYPQWGTETAANITVQRRRAAPTHSGAEQRVTK